MKIKVLPSESRLLGGNVLRIGDWTDLGKIIGCENGLLKKYRPVYIYCEVPSTDLNTIHALEEHGYRFSEFRVQSQLYTAESDASGPTLYPYTAEFTADKQHLKEARKMLLAAADDDRFSCDPLIGNEFAKKRVIRNLEKSFRRYPDEFVAGVFNQQTGKLVAFRTGAFLASNEVHYYQYATDPSLEFSHTAELLESLTIALLRNYGVEIIHAVTTGFNIGELHRLTRHHGFQMVGSTIMMRKMF